MTTLILLTSLVFAFFSVPVSAYIKKKLAATSIFGIMFGIFMGLQLLAKFWFLTQQVFEAKLFTFIIFGIIAAILNRSVVDSLVEDSTEGIPSFCIPVLLAVSAFIMGIIFIGYDINNTKEKYNILQKEHKEEMPAFDEKTKPISVPLEFAKNKLNKSFSQVPNPSYYEMGTPQIQILNGEIVYVAPVEFSGYFKWKKEKKSPGYFVLSATDSSENPKFVKKEMKYLSSAYFDNNANRKIYLKDTTTLFKGDSQFEVDDKGNPYIFKTYGEHIRKFGRVGFEPKGIVLLNVITGKIEKLTLEKVPKWIEGSVSSETVKYQNNAFGSFKNGFKNSFIGQKDVIVQNVTGNENGMTPIFVEDKMYYFSDFASPKSGIDSMMGYTLTDARTSEIVYYSGKSGDSLMDSNGAMEVADKKFIEKEWNSSIPILYNINGEPSWYMSIVDSNGFLQQIAIVSAANTEYFVSSTSSDEGMKKYKAIISGKIKGKIEAESGAEIIKEEIIVSRVYKEKSGDVTIVYLLDKKGRTFTMTTELNQKVLFIEEEDQIEIEFMNIEGAEIISALNIKTKF